MLTGLSVYLPESLLTVFDNLEFLIRIVLAAILGAMVGLERTKQQKDAGIRTHCIVALTSAVFMILSKYAFIDVVTLAGSKGRRSLAYRLTGRHGHLVSRRRRDLQERELRHQGPDDGGRYVGHLGHRHGHRRGAVLGRPCGNGGSDGACSL